MVENEFETNDEFDVEDVNYQDNTPIDDYTTNEYLDDDNPQDRKKFSRKESLRQAKQIQNDLGSQALQKIGVPKNLSNYVAKHGDGFLSPNNTIANKMLKKKGQNLIANQIEKNNENSQKSSVEQIANQAVEKGGSMALQAAGIPKPVADLISKNLAGPATELFKKKLKIKIAIACSVVFFLLIIIVPIFAAGGSANSTYDSENNEMTNYLYENGSEENLYNYLVSLGYCDTITTCSSTDAAKFYKKIKEVLSSNSNLKKHEADVFIIRLIMYGRDENQAFKAIDEIEYLAKILGDASFSIDNPESIKNQIIGQDGYFDTYRSDLFNKNSDNDMKLRVFNSIIADSKIIKEEIDSSIGSVGNYVVGGTCKYQVKGKYYANIKIQLTECESLKEPIDGGDLIDFEKYILGVVYQENSGAPKEAIKTQAIAARSYTLNRRDIEIINGQAVIKMRNCTYDQVYCDPDKGCYSGTKGGQTTGDRGNKNATVYSGYDSSKTWTRGPLSETSNMRQIVNDVTGMVAVNENGDILYTDYVGSSQEKWNAMATNNMDYVSILKSYYKEKNNFNLSVTTACSISNNLGEFSNWKQTDSKWSSIKLGNSDLTIGQAGCLVTSIAIQLAKSGVQTSISDLNPGTFVQSLNQNGGFSGANYNWSSVTNIAPNFVLVNSAQNLYGTKAQKASQLKKELDSGNFVIIRAKTNQHWVALDKVDGETVYIHDPGSSATSLWDSYPENDVTRYAVYKIQ